MHLNSIKLFHQAIIHLSETRTFITLPRINESQLAVRSDLAACELLKRMSIALRKEMNLVASSLSECLMVLGVVIKRATIRFINRIMRWIMRSCSHSSSRADSRSLVKRPGLNLESWRLSHLGKPLKARTEEVRQVKGQLQSRELRLATPVATLQSQSWGQWLTTSSTSFSWKPPPRARWKWTK